MMFSFQSGQLGHSTNTIILKSNEHKSYAWVFGVICTFQSSLKVIFVCAWDVIMGFTYPIPDRCRMCTISYSIPRWRTAISCSQCRSSNTIYYAEMHRQTFEKLTWLKGTYYTENSWVSFLIKMIFFPHLCLDMNPIWSY
jgi:hypothetical protein